MSKRQAASYQLRTKSSQENKSTIAPISFISSKQIPTISKLHLTHCRKGEQRSASFASLKKAHSARDNGSERQPLGPNRSARRSNAISDAIANTDCGPTKTLQRHIALNSSDTAASRSHRFASVAKEPCADCQAVCPEIYCTPRRAFSAKKAQVLQPACVDETALLDHTNAQVSRYLLTLVGTDSSKGRDRRSSGGQRLVLSTTPRFKSKMFPERYTSSKQHCIQKDTPDRFYDVSPSCKFSIGAAVATSSFKCSTMQSRASRLASEAAMVHNTPSLPILLNSTQESVGPGTYNPSAKLKAPVNANWMMTPLHMDRFGLPNANVAFVETRFRRFAVNNH